MSCGVGCRCGSDLALLWLWRRPAATVLIRLLAWKPPNAAGAALEKAKRQKKKKSVKKQCSVMLLFLPVCLDKVSLRTRNVEKAGRKYGPDVF